MSMVNTVSRSSNGDLNGTDRWVSGSIMMTTMFEDFEDTFENSQWGKAKQAGKWWEWQIMIMIMIMIPATDNDNDNEWQIMIMIPAPIPFS